jgi:protein SCO1/2
MQRYAPATVVAGLLMMASAAAWSNPEDHAHHHAAPAPSAPSVVELDVPDLELVDQDGRTTFFRSDLIGERLAAVTFTYTSCSTVCPILDRVFLGVQEMLPDDDGGETVLITVSIDPVNDVPKRLKAHAEKVGAEPGWRFLTGEKATVTRLLRALEVYSADIFNHPPAVYVVDGDRDVWTRLNGFPSSDMIAQVFDEYRAARELD